MIFKNKWLKISLILIVLFALALIVLSLMPGRQSQSSLLSELLIRHPDKVTVSRMSFDVGRNRNFAHAKGFVASAGTLGLQVLGPDGSETLRDSYRMTTPAIVERNGLFAAFDIGGKNLRIFDNRQVHTSIETEGLIVSASINDAGWFCVVTQEQAAGSRGTVWVYNSSGRQVLRVTIGSGFVVSAKLSGDCKNLAILNIADTGSRITVYSGIEEDKREPDYLCDLGGEIFIDFDFYTDSSVLAVGVESLVAVNLLQDNPIIDLYQYDGSRLSNYTYTDRFIALHFYYYNIGFDGYIVTIDYDGNVLGQLDISEEILSMSSHSDALTVLGSENMGFYNKSLDLYSEADTAGLAPTANRILSLDETMALAGGDLTAVIIRRDNTSAR